VAKPSFAPDDESLQLSVRPCKLASCGSCLRAGTGLIHRFRNRNACGQTATTNDDGSIGTGSKTTKPIRPVNETEVTGSDIGLNCSCHGNGELCVEDPRLFHGPEILSSHAKNSQGFCMQTHRLIAHPNARRIHRGRRFFAHVLLGCRYSRCSAACNQGRVFSPMAAARRWTIPVPRWQPPAHRRPARSRRNGRQNRDTGVRNHHVKNATPETDIAAVPANGHPDRSTAHGASGGARQVSHRTAALPDSRQIGNSAARHAAITRVSDSPRRQGIERNPNETKQRRSGSATSPRTRARHVARKWPPGFERRRRQRSE